MKKLLIALMTLGAFTATTLAVSPAAYSQAAKKHKKKKKKKKSTKTAKKGKKKKKKKKSVGELENERSLDQASTPAVPAVESPNRVVPVPNRATENAPGVNKSSTARTPGTVGTDNVVAPPTSTQSPEPNRL